MHKEPAQACGAGGMAMREGGALIQYATTSHTHKAATDRAEAKLQHNDVQLQLKAFSGAMPAEPVYTGAGGVAFEGRRDPHTRKRRQAAKALAQLRVRFPAGQKPVWSRQLGEIRLQTRARGSLPLSSPNQRLLQELPRFCEGGVFLPPSRTRLKNTEARARPMRP